MKNLIYALILLTFLPFGARASHILGGEITYEHLDNLKYKVWVTIYRDCRECKIAGGGGGSSTKDCESFDLYVQRSDRYTCDVSVLDNFKLTRTEIRNILPVCNSVRTACDSGSNFGFGAEAHIFYAIVDFSKYSTSASCGFDLFIKVFERAEDIQSINNSQQSFYNHAFINPYEAQNSPEFSPDPSLLLPVNQPFKTVIAKPMSNGDSVVYSLASPLKDFKNPLIFADGYSVSRPLTVWCKGSSSCTPEPEANPPVGYSLDPRTGYLSFTPIKTNEKAILVFEVTTYRKNGSTYQVIGVVRRDIQIETLQQDNNRPMLNTGDKVIHLCAGDNLFKEITATDDPFQYPGGGKGPQHSVTFDWWKETGAGITFKQVGIAQAPFKKLQMEWKTTESDAREAPYVVNIGVKDDHCPLRGVSQEAYLIYVHPNPKLTLTHKKLWCNNIESSVITTDGKKLKESSWTWIDEGGDTLANRNSNKDTFLRKSAGKLFIVHQATSQFGCVSTKRDSSVISETDLNAMALKLVSDSIFCEGEVMSLKVSTEAAANVSEITWTDRATGVPFNKGIEFSRNFARKNLFNQGISVMAYGNKGKLQCQSEIQISPLVNAGPDIQFNLASGYCLDNNINLTALVLPNNGQWSALNHNALIDNILQVGEFDAMLSHDACLAYQVQDTENGCWSRDTTCLRLNPIPVLALKPVTVCNFSGNFNMAIIIAEPFDLQAYDVTYMIDGSKDLMWVENGKTWVKLSDLAVGTHRVQCFITNRFGCMKQAETTITIAKDLVLEHLEIPQICRGTAKDLTELYNVSPSGGIWNSFDHFDQVFDNRINPDFCGDITLNYTYDQYGCFISGDFVLKVVCKPEISIAAPTEVCGNLKSLILDATPFGGTFSGNQVSGNTLNLEGLANEARVDYTIVSDGCAFSETKVIRIIPAPRYRYNFSPSNLKICEESPIVVENLRVENGRLSIRWNDEHVENIEVGADLRLEHYPSVADLLRGRLDITFVMEGNGNCISDTQRHVIPILPKAKFNENMPPVSDCGPLKWTSTALRMNNGVDWTSTLVLWDFGDPESGSMNTSNLITPTHNYKSAGTYDVSVRTITAAGCTYHHTWNQQVEVSETPQAKFDMWPDRMVSVRHPEVRFIDRSVSASKLTYHWDFGTPRSRDTSNLESPTFFFSGDTGSYFVKLLVTNPFGCSDEVMNTVRVGQDIQLFIPNAFTPNKKGPETNEGFTVIGINVRSYEIDIVNRWGEVVYQSSNIQESWDGNYLGKPSLGGTYAYKIRAISETGGEYKYSGTLNLIR